MKSSKVDVLTREEFDLLELIDLASMSWTPHTELQKLFRLGLVKAELAPWGPCFHSEVSATRRGTSKVNRLH